MAAPNEASNEATQQSPLCVGNCGFFGNAATMNMCSKCFRLYKLEHPEVSTVAAAPVADKPAEPSSEAMDLGDADDASSTKSENKNKKKCVLCKKKVGLHGFKCKCGNLYCAGHRIADSHNCTYDYRADARAQLERANPAIRGEKLARF
eukprot:c53369_g1_i1.p1 GENE.c53369_g1_i1~~c53369_g1_i1.p1  ORF type:complete len:149 (+),score=23.18 c53369_g1_i1:190-636(+)